MDISIYLELGSRRVFACAVEWPGWCRSARTEDEAVATLAAYAPRYAAVARAAGVSFPKHSLSFVVLERVPGDGTTDFGAPGRVPDLDREPLPAPALERLTGLVRASWHLFDAAAAVAPAVLPKGPRGGGRDRDEIVRHVLAAETAYARKIGVRRPEPAASDTPAIAALRDEIVAALRTATGVQRGWPARYACRRIAWHVLDHAWELEDKSA